jgi:large subunit ribosomal protein L15
MLTLHSLPKTTTKRQRVGRGGNRGKNSGAGHKGQLKRAGKTRVGFEGGQKPLTRRTPKFKGYQFAGKKSKQTISLPNSYIEKFFKDGEQVTLQILKDSDAVEKTVKKVRVFYSKPFTKKLLFDTNSDTVYVTKGVSNAMGV